MHRAVWVNGGVVVGQQSTVGGGVSLAIRIPNTVDERRNRLSQVGGHRRLAFLGRRWRRGVLHHGCTDLLAGCHSLGACAPEVPPQALCVPGLHAILFRRAAHDIAQENIVWRASGRRCGWVGDLTVGNARQQRCDNDEACFSIGSQLPEPSGAVTIDSLVRFPQRISATDLPPVRRELPVRMTFLLTCRLLLSLGVLSPPTLLITKLLF